MKQQINLHQPIFRKQRALFSAQIVLRVCIIWVIALGLIYALSVWRQGEQSREKSRLTAERDAASIRLQELLLKQADPQHSAELEAQLKQLKAERTQKEGVIRVLARGDLGVTTGFSGQMQVLAERRVDGVWLTRIGLRSGGQHVTLQGHATGEDRVPEYLERLAGRMGDARFAGGRFAQVSLGRAAEAELVQFELSTRAGQETSR